MPAQMLILQTNFVMKKFILFFLLAFGDVKLGETRKATFTLTSSADVVVILSASTNCECTKASWGRKPLHKGDKSTVEVSYEAREKGFFRKNITIRYTTGGAASTLRLTVTGNVP